MPQETLANPQIQLQRTRILKVFIQVSTWGNMPFGRRNKAEVKPRRQGDRSGAKGKPVILTACNWPHPKVELKVPLQHLVATR